MNALRLSRSVRHNCSLPIPVRLRFLAHPSTTITTLGHLRPFSADRTSTHASSGEDTKHKPKASTPLRRSAAASLPIRANPTPTRSSIHPVLTFATAERYLPTRLRARLPPRSQKLHDAWWVPRWGRCEDGSGGGGEAFVFSNGSFVCWGMTEDEAHRFAREVLAPCEIGSLHEPETESLDFVSDPNEYVPSASPSRCTP